MADQLFDIRDHVAVVTGSTSGIGRAMAEALARAGAKVVLNGLGDAGEIERTRAEMERSTGSAVRYHGADMTRPDQISDLVASAEREFGRLDILLNNAGVQHVSPVEDFPPEKWDLIIAVNLSAAFHATRAAVPIMKRQGRGRIVNLASAHSLVASPFKSAYVAAKHGIAGFTKSVALEVAQSGITCNAISPGYVRTPLVENQIADTAKARGISEEAVMRDVLLAAQPTKRFVEYAELAGLLLYLASDAGASANGANFSVDGGWTAA
jgi:3-hydroxybutyrate dehydrogenase